MRLLCSDDRSELNYGVQVEEHGKIGSSIYIFSTVAVATDVFY